MQKIRLMRSLGFALLLCGIVVVSSAMRTEANPRSRPVAGQMGAVSIDSDDIGGTVTSANGPEAGVWVIAETTLGTKFRKIVVTNDKGQYLLPQLPNGTYKIWVRGYGLVDSTPVESTPGKNLDLTA